MRLLDGARQRPLVADQQLGCVLRAGLSAWQSTTSCCGLRLSWARMQSMQATTGATLAGRCRGCHWMQLLGLGFSAHLGLLP